jgi:uncharacterized protein (TIGR04255 family)
MAAAIRIRATADGGDFAMKRKRADTKEGADDFPHLPAAPIVEAVIHWQARATKAWQPEDLKKELGALLSTYPDCRPQRLLHLEAQLDSADNSATQIRRDGWHGFRLTSSDKLYVVQFTSDGLVFSRLPPYENWQLFVSEGRRLWEIFQKVMAPAEVQRLGVRFINRIRLLNVSDVDRFLALRPRGHKSLHYPTTGFLYQSTVEVPGEPFQVNIIEATQPDVSGQGAGLILDIDVFTSNPMSTQNGALDKALQKMHTIKNRVFFGLLKKKALKSFMKGET